jgi:hypothetical protein
MAEDEILFEFPLVELADSWYNILKYFLGPGVSYE